MQGFMCYGQQAQTVKKMNYKSYGKSNRELNAPIEKKV